MNRAVIYVRVSSKEQAEGGYSIEAQQEACRRFASDRGWIVDNEYVDAGESATTAARPQLQKMLSDLADGRAVSYVVVHKVDRLARSLEDHLDIRARFKRAGVSLVSVSEGLEDTPAGRMLERFLATISAWYSENLGQEVRKGMKQKAQDGIWPSLAPVGYLNVRSGPGRKAESVLKPDPERAPLVREAFELYATGQWTLTSLYEEMKRRGLRTRTGRPVARSKIARMLRHEVYAGIVRWGDIERQGIHDPLVSLETFNRVQDVFKAHDKSAPRSRKHDHYLRGTLYCANCGSRMSSMLAKGGRFPYFFCIGRMQRRTDCHEPYVPIDQMAEQVQALYRRMRVSDEGRKLVGARLEREIADQVTGGQAAAARYTRRLAVLQSERSKLMRAYLKDLISDDLLKTELVRIEGEETDLKRRAAVDRGVLEKARGTAEAAIGLLANCSTAYAEAREEIRRSWNQAVFKAIYIGDGLVKRLEFNEPLGALLMAAGSNSVPSGEPPGIRTRNQRIKSPLLCR